MKHLILAAVVAVSGYIGTAAVDYTTVAHATCTATCDPEVSKPCGQVCISKYKSCHKPTTTACMGEAGRSTKKTYDTPTHVEPDQYKSTTKQD